MTNSLKSKRRKDKFDRMADRLLSGQFACTIPDLAAALRRVDRTARKQAAIYEHSEHCEGCIWKRRCSRRDELEAM